MLTLKDYLMGRDLTHSKELTQDIIDNSNILLLKVNKLLKELNILNVQVSSGWRPPSLNAKVVNAAKKSLHMTGCAVDLATQEVALALQRKPELLEKYQLWLENPAYTKSWTHLDIGNRKSRKLRIFNP